MPYLKNKHLYIILIICNVKFDKGVLSSLDINPKHIDITHTIFHNARVSPGMFLSSYM
jgi:hypothetical protein